MVIQKTVNKGFINQYKQEIVRSGIEKKGHSLRVTLPLSDLVLLRTINQSHLLKLTSLEVMTQFLVTEDQTLRQ